MRWCLDDMGRIDVERVGQFSGNRIEMGPGDLAHDGQAVAIRQPGFAGIRIRFPQRTSHQPDRIETLFGFPGPIIDLADADDNRDRGRIARHDQARLSLSAE